MNPETLAPAVLSVVLLIGGFDLLFAFLFRIPRAAGGGSGD